MRIAYLTQSYPPMISGAAILVERLANSMAARGHQVLVIAASDSGRPYLSGAEGFTIARLTSIHNPLRVGQRFLFYPCRAVLETLQEFSPDLVHTHEPVLMGRLGVAYARSARIPVLLTVHQVPWFAASYLPAIPGFRSLVESVLWMYARQVAPRFTAVLTPSQTISSLVTARTGIRTHTIGNGVSLRVFQPSLSRKEEGALRKRLGLPPHVPILLHVGRLDRDKNVERVVRAAARAMQQTGVHLLIVGDGSCKPALMRLCEALGIGQRVHFPGYIGIQEGLPQIYGLASLFVTASEIEVQSLVLLEAVASGLPIVAVRAGFTPELVQDGVNGLLSEPGDITGLANALATLLQNPRRRSEMGERSLGLAKGHADQLSVDLHEQLYMSLVNRKEAPAFEAEPGMQSQWTRFRRWAGIRE